MGVDYPYDERIQYVCLPTNMGAVRASNVGFMLSYLSPAQFILILDNDARIPDGDKDWLERWMKHFDDSIVGAAGATSDRVAGYQQIFKVPETYLKEWINHKSGDHGETGPIFVPWLISFACMYRKEAMAKIADPRGLWDERFEPGNSEDIDASLRLREAGYKCALSSDIYVHHDMSATFTKNFDFGELLKTNHAKLVKKWGQEKLTAMGVAISYE
jgi:GT2 family glycosyltransferase